MKAVQAPSASSTRAAFTLVELIIVIGIMVLLASLLVPMISKTVTQANRTKMAADLQAIANGLDAYKLDHKDLPRADINGTTNGAVLLCWALVAPGPAQADGAPGPGFRLRGVQGQVYGPYINVESFRLVDVNSRGKPNLNVSSADQNTAIGDRYSIPIYYCPAALNPDLTPGAAVLDDSVQGSPSPKFDFNYFKDANGPIIPKSEAQKILTDSPATTAPFLLWSAGVNTKFGFDAAGKTVSDDVTNFRN